MLAQASLGKALASLETMLKATPDDMDRQAERANLQVLIDVRRQRLHESGNTAPVVRTALDTLRSLARKDEASPHVLSLAYTAWAEAEPASLRDPGLTLALAQRLVAMTHRKAPEGFLALAEGLRTAGYADQSRRAALEGLALLPAPAKNAPIPRIRKLLAIEANDQSRERQVPGAVEVF